MDTRFGRWLKDGSPLWFILLLLAWGLVRTRLGPTVPLTESSEMWLLREHPWMAVFLGGYASAVLIVLGFIPPQRHGARRVLRWATYAGGVVGALILSPAVMLLAATLDWKMRPSAEKDEPRSPAPPSVPLPRISPLVILIPVLLAPVAALLHIKVTTGNWLPHPPPEEELLLSQHFLSAAAVRSPPSEGSARRLVLDPRVTREQLLEHVQNERTGWWAAQVLQKLEARQKLAALPLTEEAHVRALPLDSDVLVTPEGASLAGHPLWGVVIEAEGPQKQRRTLVSLGADDPALSPAPTYALLFEESAPGGPPRLLQAEHDFPNAAGISVRVPRQSLFFLYLLAAVIVVVLMVLWLQSRALRAQRPEPPSAA